MQYHVTQEAGTERPFTGEYCHLISLRAVLIRREFLLAGAFDKHYETGMYVCIVCRQELFSSETKFDAGCGWPAFNDVLDKGKITLHKDTSIAGN